MTQTYTRKSNCMRAARAQLGPHAEPGADFILTEYAGRFSWTASSLLAPHRT